jgi:hypothetical protein
MNNIGTIKGIINIKKENNIISFIKYSDESIKSNILMNEIVSSIRFYVLYGNEVKYFHN